MPLLNFIIIGILGTFLLKLTTKYTGLYMKNSLITIIVTNLVLYGISETLAQTILSYKSNQPLIGFRINDAPGTGLSFNSSDISFSRSPFVPYSDAHDATDDEIDEEGLDRFIDYIQQESDFQGNTIGPGTANFAGELPSPVVELTYYLFSRLAGFMCWGFIMAFVQCWWYKFLQIYSKDPKFIEVLRKVLTDQLCYSPISLFSFFTYGTMVLESGSWEDAKVKLSKIYIRTLLINYSVWFPVQFFNFLVVPRSFQVPFSSSVAVLWNCFLSMRNSTV